MAGNAIHLSVAGGARLTASRLQDSWINTVVTGVPGSSEPTDVWLGDARLSGGWTMSGTVERLAPTAADAVSIAAGDESETSQTILRPLMTSGGAGGPYLASPPQGEGAAASRNALRFPRLTAASRTWIGSQDNLWSNPNNWNPAGVPQDNEQLVFGQDGQNRKQMINDLSSLVVGGVTVQQGSYSIGGAGLTLASGGSSTTQGGDFSVARLAGGGALSFDNKLIVQQRASTTFSGTLSGSEFFLEGGTEGVFTYTGNGSGVSRTYIKTGQVVLNGGRLGDVLTEGGTFVMRNGAAAGSLTGNNGQIGTLDGSTGSVNELRFNGGTAYVQPISGPDAFQVITANSCASYTGPLTVSLRNNYVPAIGATFRIIDCLSGGRGNNNFNGLPEGATVTSGNVKFTISYVAGTGNDVVLTVIENGAPTPTADLVITKSHAPAAFAVGGQGTYTLTVSNKGPGATNGTLVSVFDRMPAQFQPVGINAPGWTCDIAGVPIGCTRNDKLEANASYPPIQITVSVRLDATDGVNEAGVSGGGDSSLASITDPTAISRAVDLKVSKSHDGQFSQGGQGIYLLAVANVGSNSTTSPITVTDDLPAELTATAATGDGWACTLGRPLVCVRAAPLALSAAAPVIRVTVAISPTAPASVTNRVTVKNAEDINPANDTASDTTAVATTGPILTGAKRQDGALVRGQNGVVILTITNSGNARTNSTIIVEDTLPAGFTPRSASGAEWTCRPPTGQLVHCERAAGLNPAAVTTIRIELAVAADAQNASNTATVSGGGDATPESFDAPMTVSGTPPDLIISKTHSGEVTQGGTVSFAIVVTNVGTSPSSGEVTVVDRLPAGLTPTGPSGTVEGWNCSLSGQEVTCKRTSSLAGNGATYPAITVVAAVSNNAAPVLVNQVTVAGGGDTTPGNNSASDTVNIATIDPDLTITKTHNGSLVPGQTGASFTITVSNVGARATHGDVTVVDTFRSGLTPRSASGPGWNCSITAPTVTCVRGDELRPASAYGPLTILADVAANATSDVNTADVTGGGDVSPANNTANDPYQVSGSPQLYALKTHSGEFVVGQIGAVYSISVLNRGSATTTAPIVLTDPLPEGLVPVSAGGAGWSCQIQSQLVTCTLPGPLAPQVAAVMTITVNVSETAHSVVNIATITGGGDPTAGERPASDPTTVAGRPQLTLLKSHADPVLQGQQGLQFALRVLNNGSGSVTQPVTVSDTLPNGLRPVDASGNGWSCGIGGQTVTCTRADALAAGSSYDVLYVSVNVAADAVSTTNVATVSGGGDTTPQDNTVNDQVAISAPGTANLVMVKQHDGDFVQGQSNAEYRLRADNRGSAPSAGEVIVTDNLPDGMRPAGVAADGWSCSISGQQVVCRRSDALAPGRSWPVIHIAVEISASAASAVNTATLSGGGDSTPADNSASDATTVTTRAPNLTITKTHADPFLGGQANATYHIAVTNVGTGSTIGDVIVTDDVPNGMIATQATGDGWQCSIASSVATCRRNDPLAAGAAYPQVTLLVNVQTSATSIANVATVAGGGDTTPGNNSATDFTNVNGSVDAALGMSLVSDLVVGQEATYLVQVNNLGPGILGGDTAVTIDFPEILLPLGGLGSGWQCQIHGQRFQCVRPGTFGPGVLLPDLRIRVLVAGTNSPATITAVLNAPGDSNGLNDSASVTSAVTTPVTALRVRKTAGTDRVAIGGTVTYRVEVANIGEARVASTTLSDLLPRGFRYADTTSEVQSTTRSTSQVPTVRDGDQAQLEWQLGTLSPGETVNVSYRVIVGADARVGKQDNKATVSGIGVFSESVAAGPAVASVEVTGDTFTELQAVVGRVYQDLDGNGRFNAADRPLADVRVITSTGQAAVTDPDGLYNIPSLGSGTVVLSLDRSTIPGNLTITDDEQGGRSWTRMVRTPVGGGTVLRQNFALVTSGDAGADASVAHPPQAPPAMDETSLEKSGNSAGVLPPRRDYVSRDGSSLLVALGEVSFGQAAPEFELYKKDGDAWGYGSVFLQTPVGSPENKLTVAYDSHRRLNGTGERARLFELDPNDRFYPVFGDTSRREEFATSNSKFFGRLERGPSYVMWGDLVGDLVSSDRDGGRWSTYQRHLTGVEGRIANQRGDQLAIRGAQPSTSYARDVFSGSTLGLLSLAHGEVLTGTETVAVEIRDRRTPERLLSRDVLARAVDYEIEPLSGAIFLKRHVGGLDEALNLVQLVVTYEYQGTGLDNTVYGGRGSWGYRGLRLGGSVFSEEGVDSRFNVFGVNLEQRMPRGGRLLVDVPYSDGTPNVSTSINTVPVGQVDSSGAAVQATLEQPFAFWNGRLDGRLLGADRAFQNPFSSTITPGARYASGIVGLTPRVPSKIRFGVIDEAYETANVGRAPHDAVGIVGRNNRRAPDAHWRLRPALARSR